MKKYIVDRIEEGIAVLEKEDMSHIEIPLSDFGIKVSEGNVLIFENGEFTLDEHYEKERRRRLFEKQKNIFKNK